MKRFFSILVARNLEFFRDKATLFWNIVFPFFLIFGFAFAFSGNPVSYKIGTVGENPPNVEFLKYKYLQFIPYKTLEPALKKLSHHQVDMVLDYQAGDYYINTEAPNGYMVEKVLMSDPSQKFKRQTVQGQVVRYIDWFIPGVIGMNILFGCLFGVGYVIVRYRSNGVLKRFKATPMHAYEFILAQIVSRFLIVAFMSVLVYAGTNFFLHFRMYGSYLNLMLVAAIAIICHIALGLVFATRLKSQEVADGLMNFFIWPMMLLSGIWFSLEGAPKVLQDFSKIFPITHFTEASRKIMLDGVGLAGVMDNIIPMLGMTVVFIVVSAFIFKWE